MEIYAAQGMDFIKAKIEAGDQRSIESFLTMELRSKLIPEIGMELYTDVCVNNLTDDNFKNNTDLYACIEWLMKLIAEHVSPKSYIIELLCLLSPKSSNNQFISALKALQLVLMRHNDRPKDFKHCFDAIAVFLRSRTLPSIVEQDYSRKEAKLLEQDAEVAALIELYKILTFFYKALIDKILSADNNNQLDVTKAQILKACSCFLISILGHPLGLIRISFDKDMLLTNCYTHEIACTLTRDISLYLKSDPFQLLTYIEMRAQPSKCMESRDNCYLDADYLPLSSLGMYFYTLFVGEQWPTKMPRIYAYSFVFENCLHTVRALLKAEEPIYKKYGLELFEKLLQKPPHVYLTRDNLNNGVYLELFKCLVEFVCYSPSGAIQKKSTELFTKFIGAFECAGAYSIIQYILTTNPTDFFVGLLFRCYKDLFHAHHKSGAPLPAEFSGAAFRKMLLQAINCLPNGRDTKIGPLCSRLTYVTNCLYYFATVDKTNQTGFWNNVKEITDQFIEPLEHAVEFSLNCLNFEYKQAESDYEGLLKKYQTVFEQSDYNFDYDDEPCGQKQALQNISEAVNQIHILKLQLNSLKQVIGVKKL